VGFTQDGESVVLTIGGTMEILNLEGEVVGANEIGGRSFWARTSRRFNQLYVVGGAGDMMRVSLPDLTMEQRRPVATQRTPGNADRDMLGGLSPDERWIGLYTQSQSLQWIPIDDKGEIGSPQRSEIFPRVLRFSRSGRRFAVVTTNEEVWIGTLQDESPGVSVQLPGKGFADAAFALKPGTIGPDPVKSEFGWHVIKVVDKRRQPAPSFEESRGQIEQQLTRDLIAAHMAELRADAKIELFNIDGSPVVDTPKK